MNLSNQPAEPILYTAKFSLILCTTHTPTHPESTYVETDAHRHTHVDASSLEKIFNHLFVFVITTWGKINTPILDTHPRNQFIIDVSEGTCLYLMRNTVEETHRDNLHAQM